MADRLRRRWDELLHRVRAWAPGEDPTPVAEACGYALVYALLEAVEQLPAADRALLRGSEDAAVARARALALASPDDEREGWLGAAAVVRAGARVLRGGGLELGEVASDVFEPTPQRLLALVHGELDGVSAASVVAWYLRHDAEEARALHRLHSERVTRPSDRVLLAADAKRPVRSPAGGRTVGALDDLRLEAVYFPDERQLALYCSDDVPVRLAAPGLTTLDAQPGYWLGQLGSEVGGERTVELRVGDAVRAWVLKLGEA